MLTLRKVRAAAVYYILMISVIFFSDLHLYGDGERLDRLIDTAILVTALFVVVLVVFWVVSQLDEGEEWK